MLPEAAQLKVIWVQPPSFLLSRAATSPERRLQFTFLILVQKGLDEEHCSPKLPLAIEASLCQLTHLTS